MCIIGATVGASGNGTTLVGPEGAGTRCLKNKQLLPVSACDGLFKNRCGFMLSMDALEGGRASPHHKGSERSAYASKIVHKERRRASAACSGADVLSVLLCVTSVLFCYLPDTHMLLSRQTRCCAKGDTAPKSWRRFYADDLLHLRARFEGSSSDSSASPFPKQGPSGTCFRLRTPGTVRRAWFKRTISQRGHRPKGWSARRVKTIRVSWADQAAAGMRLAWYELAVGPEMLLEQNTTDWCHRVRVCNSIRVEIVKVSSFDSLSSSKHQRMARQG